MCSGLRLVDFAARWKGIRLAEIFIRQLGVCVSSDPVILNTIETDHYFL